MKRGLMLFVLLLTLAALAVAMGSKQAKEKQKHAADSTQGITGKVEIWEGNFMPMVEPGKSGGKVTPGADRRVRAYQPVKSQGGMVTAQLDSVPSAMVAEALTDTAGKFFIPVPPGTYSVFVQEKTGWYANGWNGDGVQGAVTVDSGKTSNVLIKITTKATF